MFKIFDCNWVTLWHICETYFTFTVSLIKVSQFPSTSGKRKTFESKLNFLDIFNKSSSFPRKSSIISNFAHTNEEFIAYQHVLEATTSRVTSYYKMKSDVSADVDMKAKIVCFHLSLRSFVSSPSPFLSNKNIKLYISKFRQQSQKKKKSTLKWFDRQTE